MSTGATILLGPARIEPPLVRVGNPHWLTMDGVIPVKGEDVFCWFSYFRENISQNVPAGTYDIKAVVRFVAIFHSSAPFPV